MAGGDWGAEIGSVVRVTRLDCSVWFRDLVTRAHKA